jgi:hypothetical protein
MVLRPHQYRTHERSAGPVIFLASISFLDFSLNIALFLYFSFITKAGIRLRPALWLRWAGRREEARASKDIAFPQRRRHDEQSGIPRDRANTGGKLESVIRQ